MSKCKALITDCPDKRNVLASVFYGIVSFVVGPFWLCFFGFGLELNPTIRIWVQFAYYIVNCLVIIFIYKEYLQDAFMYVQMEPRKFVARVADGVVLILMASAIVYGIGYKIEEA